MVTMAMSVYTRVITDYYMREFTERHVTTYGMYLCVMGCVIIDIIIVCVCIMCVVCV